MEIINSIRAFMPALLAVGITALWGVLILRGDPVPDALNNAVFTALAFFFGQRSAELRNENVRALNGITPPAANRV